MKSPGANAHIRRRQLSRSSPVRLDRPDVVEPGGTARARERDQRRVGRPGRLEVVDPVARQAPRAGAVCADDPDLARRTLAGRAVVLEGDPPRAGRPRGVPRDGEAAARHLRPAAAVRPHLPDVPVSHVGDPFPVGRPVGRGLVRRACSSALSPRSRRSPSRTARGCRSGCSRRRCASRRAPTRDRIRLQAGP